MENQTQTPETNTNPNESKTDKVVAEKFAQTITELWLSNTNKKSFLYTVIRNQDEKVIKDFKAPLPKTTTRDFLDQPAFADLNIRMEKSYTVVRMP
ncbi:hypothetical protein WAF17_02350 [Bernardetia sp. ABR2-2B]|uniref:hypothetical protein n=1 Tax=Bernardetia sp. ABR2-2B TaxID=3127472 RepID=UPI0030D1DAA5